MQICCPALFKILFSFLYSEIFFFLVLFYFLRLVFSLGFYLWSCLAHLYAPVLGRGPAHGRHSISVC